MTVRTMRLFEDRIEAGGAKPIYLPYGDRAIFVREGAAHFVTPSTHQYLSADLAYAGDDQLTLEVESLAAVLWRFELADGTDLADEAFALRSAPAGHQRTQVGRRLRPGRSLRLAAALRHRHLPRRWVAWTHLHQAPACGSPGTARSPSRPTAPPAPTAPPGDPWAEFGVLPVLAPTTPHEATSFTRCFALPAQLKGVSSLRTVHAEDRAKPNTQSYRVLAEYAMDA